MPKNPNSNFQIHHLDTPGPCSFCGKPSSIHIIEGGNPELVEVKCFSICLNGANDILANKKCIDNIPNIPDDWDSKDIMVLGNLLRHLLKNEHF